MDTLFYSSPMGTLILKVDSEYVYSLESSMVLEENNSEILNQPLVKECFKQLDEYFNGFRKAFNLPIKLKGTEFQEKVWQELLKIPYGTTCTYGEIADRIGKPRAARAIGGANNKNKLMIIVPCHRVIGRNGKLVGYAGGLDKKKYLLDLEKNII